MKTSGKVRANIKSAVLEILASDDEPFTLSELCYRVAVRVGIVIPDSGGRFGLVHRQPGMVRHLVRRLVRAGVVRPLRGPGPYAYRRAW